MKNGGALQQQEAAALAAAAHELKSPLALVQHIAQTLADTQTPLTETERAQYLARLQFTSDRMMRLVQQLAVSYRLQADQQLAFAFTTEPLNAVEVCEGVAHELEPLARAHNQRIDIASQRSQLVIANRDILHDIVVNLIDNAIRHNPIGGSVRLASSAHGNMVRLSVHDQGAGVGASELRNLRHTLGTQPQPLGGRSATSGLGLYIVGQFAAAMGGSVGLGRPGQGSHFFVDLLRSKQMSFL
ncbi:MAG TPA: HAMP domain-containing sensor histidine kinase [Candidatus Saccharimonas sp.]|nr:HAMP domain-containing sensor histidine kinase [Candidatus Saccharimonas sp.]